MFNFEYLRIPKDDSDFEEEPEDELASAGFRVVGETEEEEEADEPVEAAVAGLEDELAVDEEAVEDKEDASEGPVDGLQELEELEKGYANIPLSYDDPEE